jgi:hypothetical protein
MYITYLATNRRKSHLLKDPELFEKNIDLYAMTQWKSLCHLVLHGHIGMRELTISFFRALGHDDLNNALDELINPLV